MQQPAWHAESLDLLRAAAAADPEVRELWAFGSAATGELDGWSDLDVALVCAPEAAAGLASPHWLSLLGDVWAYERSSRPGGAGVRGVFADGRWIDLIAVDEVAAIPSERRRIQFGGEAPAAPMRSGAVPQVPEEVNEFRLIAALAVVKAARDDLLIGGHLALELLRRCLVVAMRLRDRDTGTRHHRRGGRWNDVLDRVLDLVPDAATGAAGVLDLVDAAAGLFDQLAVRLWSSYRPDWSGLTALLDRARTES